MMRVVNVVKKQLRGKRIDYTDIRSESQGILGPNTQRIEVAFPSPVEPTSLPLITLNAGSKFNPPKAG